MDMLETSVEETQRVVAELGTKLETSVRDVKKLLVCGGDAAGGG